MNNRFDAGIRTRQVARSQPEPLPDASVPELPAGGTQATGKQTIQAGTGLTIVLRCYMFFLRSPKPSVLVVLILFSVLPFHFLILSIFTKIGIPDGLLKFLPLWKELLLCIILMFSLPVLIRKIFALKIFFLDTVVFCLFSGLFVYSYNAFLVGIRSAVFFFALPYLLGRLFNPTDRDLQRIITAFKVVAAIAALSAIIEKFFLPVDFWRQIGLVDYLTFVGFFTYSPPGPYGLPWTFFNSLGMKRSGGIFANPLDLSQGLAVLISLPVISLLITRKKVFTNLSLLILIYVGVILSGSRTNLVVATVIVLVLVLRYYPSLAVLLSLLMGLVVTCMLVISEDLFLFFFKTVTFQEHSSNFHLNAWLAGWNAFLARPFGYGMGTSGLLGHKTGNIAIGGESDYVVKLVQTGIIGTILYIYLLITGLSVSWNKLLLMHQIKHEFLLFFGVTFSALLTLSLAGITSEVSLFPRIVCWFFLGCSLTLYSRSKSHKQFKSDKVVL